MFFSRWIIISGGFLVAIFIVPGIETQTTGPWDTIAVSLVAGFINCIFGPIFRFFTFPIVIVTLGLWIFFANMIMFWFAGYLGSELGFGFTVSGFWATFFGALVVSFVSLVFSGLYQKR